MPSLAYTDHRADPQAWAHALHVSREAIDLYLSCDVIDLHVDSFIWTRSYQYDLTRSHGRGLFGARLYSQVDLPRAREAHLTGAIWVITTNPLRTGRGRADVFVRNIERLRSILASCADDVVVVRTVRDYRSAVASGKHAAWIGIQGGNALEWGENGANDSLDRIPDGLIVRITLVHLYNSQLGITSTPGVFGLQSGGLSAKGRTFVERLDEKRIFVDLAHINRQSFFDAVEAHDKSLPLIVTHTGVAGVHPHWRNLDDAQLRAIADTGGTIGIMYHRPFLGGDQRAARIVDHMEHVIAAVGDDFVSLGSDWDGAITTPRDMQTCLELPKLVQIMLDRRWPEERIRKALGGNFLRALRLLRGE
ncbi:MAG TPA: membrane dipeptidase [Polyangiaceae bacterium]